MVGGKVSIVQEAFGAGLRVLALTLWEEEEDSVRAGTWPRVCAHVQPSWWGRDSVYTQWGPQDRAYNVCDPQSSQAPPPHGPSTPPFSLLSLLGPLEGRASSYLSGLLLPKQIQVRREKKTGEGVLAVRGLLCNSGWLS